MIDLGHALWLTLNASSPVRRTRAVHRTGDFFTDLLAGMMSQSSGQQPFCIDMCALKNLDGAKATMNEVAAAFVRCMNTIQACLLVLTILFSASALAAVFMLANHLRKAGANGVTTTASGLFKKHQPEIVASNFVHSASKEHRSDLTKVHHRHESPSPNRYGGERLHTPVPSLSGNDLLTIATTNSTTMDDTGPMTQEPT